LLLQRLPRNARMPLKRGCRNGRFGTALGFFSEQPAEELDRPATGEAAG